MKPHIVSVIIPTKNSGRTINKCLSRVLSQKYPNIEIILVDNNSNDNTLKIAKKYTKNIYSIGPERSAQRNFGARISRGKYILFLDSDQYLNPITIMECVNIINGPKCHAIIIPERSIGLGYWAKVKSFEREFYLNNPLIEAARFFDKTSFFAVGGYNEQLSACEDWDLQNRFNISQMFTKRAKKYLDHDEGNLDLFKLFSKKKYYSHWIRDYKNLYPELSRKQFSFFFRFPLNQIIRKSFKNPILMCSMIFMKLVEGMSLIKR